MINSNMLLARIKQLRNELNVQQRQIAYAIGVDEPMYSRIERGIRPFRDEYIAPIADILHVKEEELRSLWTADKIINVTKDEPLLVAQRALRLANSEIRTNLHE
ncbi:helix-turn-helix transcriptional regulator [Bacteroides sp. Marseille-P3684]|uniref:helix-turn-helix domain-containing protein n=1 Tax=Bacteroides sp. Marseille-P3684 TaxID=2086579 RepID=UPI001300A628|nr:helix-turn-helix transcriptional regulator [Bacteroides sp. Marseille-P3684]